MRVATFCFVSATFAALCGMSLGIYLGLGGAMPLQPVHTHLNLLGWVTMGLYGLYHRGVHRKRNSLAWVQVGCGAAGFALMAVGIWGTVALGHPASAVATVAGAILAMAGMALFLVVVAMDQLTSNLPTDSARRDYGW